MSNPFRLRWLSVLSAAVLIACSQGADAGLLIDAGTGSSLQNFSTGNYVAGTEFTTSTSFTIRALGFLDAEGDGLTASHTVGLWDASTQALLTSVVVTPTSVAQLTAQGTGVWYLEDVAAIVIGPGTYRVAGTMATDSTSLSNGKIGNGVTLTSGYVRTDFPNGGFSFPNLTFASQALHATLSTDSVSVVATGVPEPSTVASLGLAGLIGLAARFRRWLLMLA